MKGAFPLYAVASSLAIIASQDVSALEFDASGRYTWLLPKTVLDAAITYTVKECRVVKDAAGKDNTEATVSISATLSPRYIPDLRVGQQSIKLGELQNAFQNQDISITTFATSHILNSIGSAPADQTLQIAGSVITAIPKLFGIALKTAAVPLGTQVTVAGVATGENPTITPVPAACQSKDNLQACQALACVAGLKAMMSNNDLLMAGGLDDTTQKRATAANQAALALITDLQSRLSFTLKSTIDPGFTPIQVDADREANGYVEAGNGQVQKDGLIAKYCPSARKLADVGLTESLKDETKAEF